MAGVGVQPHMDQVGVGTMAQVGAVISLMVAAITVALTAIPMLATIHLQLSMHHQWLMRHHSPWFWLHNPNQQFGIFAKQVGNFSHTYKSVPQAGRPNRPFRHRAV